VQTIHVLVVTHGQDTLDELLIASPHIDELKAHAKAHPSWSGEMWSRRPGQPFALYAPGRRCTFLIRPVQLST